MRTAQPPVLANWLLDRLGYTSQNPALAGDLLEEFHSGRSIAWYWRQTLMVIATGIGKNAFVQRRYLTACIAGFIAQAAVAFCDWWIDAQHRAHSPGRFAVQILLAVLVIVVYAAWVKIQIASGPKLAELRLLLSAGANSSQSPLGIMVQVALYKFAPYYSTYSIGALLLPRWSLGYLACAELSWFSLFVLGPALVGVPSARKTKAWKTPDYRELSLLLTYAGGQTLLLQPETVVESIFATGDEQLAAAVFQRSASVELLRRAIWLGCDGTRTPTLALNDLLLLVDEARRTKPLELRGKA